MNTDLVSLSFDPSFTGTMTSPTGTVKLGNQNGGLLPYHLLYGALGSCFYATFLSIVKKKRLTFQKASMTITGTKRDEVPPTLSEVTISMIISNPSDENQFIKSAELGAKYCSIHETVSKVANIKLDVVFSYEE
jgi:putative redox protein